MNAADTPSSQLKLRGGVYVCVRACMHVPVWGKARACVSNLSVSGLGVAGEEAGVLPSSLVSRGGEVPAEAASHSTGPLVRCLRRSSPLLCGFGTDDQGTAASLWRSWAPPGV